MVKNFTGKELQEFKDNFKILSYWAPTTFKSTIDGQKFAIAIGCPWIPIPNDMTLDEVHERWIKKEFPKPKENKIVIKVPASRGKTEYTVSFSDKWNCTCSAFKFKKNCKHIDSVKLELKNKFK